MTDKPKKKRNIFHIFAVLYKPFLSLLGVKKGTVADKAGDVIEEADKVIPK